jgi:hypothetical protein
MIRILICLSVTSSVQNTLPRPMSAVHSGRANARVVMGRVLRIPVVSGVEQNDRI